jgi:cytochrome c-type biogenesis protein CcmH/NrfF
MTHEDHNDDRSPDGTTPAPAGDPPRSVNLGVVAGVVILVGLIAFAVYRQRGNVPTAASEAPPAQRAETVAAGTAISAATVNLSPEGQIAAERYRCICGCNDPLSVCTCTRTPGSIDMKQHVQDQVDQRKTPAEIDQAMVAKYGAAVLLSNPAPPRTAGP